MIRPRLVLFDIGSTLWSSPAEDLEALRLCYGRGRQHLLRAVEQAPDHDALVEAVEGYFAEWEERWRLDSSLVLQRPTTDFVAEALARVGVAVDAETLAAFTEAILETSVHTAKVEPAEEGMAEALARLKDMGLLLGGVSNAFMGAGPLMRIMEERGLGAYLDVMVSSCELGYRKPHPEIYLAALKHFDIRPQETVFVGDRLDADVAGPASLGMRTVLTHQYRREDPDGAKIKPDRVIAHLRELPDYLEELFRG
jgi:HAD superfamily hydrolase (TIGR01509 family)